MVGLGGVEPPHTEPESAVLPLYYSPDNNKSPFGVPKMVGPGGFEPPYTWTKTMCLTT